MARTGEKDLGIAAKEVLRDNPALAEQYIALISGQVVRQQVQSMKRKQPGATSTDLESRVGRKSASWK
jgi:hypothetical protein